MPVGTVACLCGRAGVQVVPCVRACVSVRAVAWLGLGAGCGGDGVVGQHLIHRAELAPGALQWRCLAFWLLGGHRCSFLRHEEGGDGCLGLLQLLIHFLVELLAGQEGFH